jgi:hypothetical protein
LLGLSVFALRRMAVRNSRRSRTGQYRQNSYRSPANNRTNGNTGSSGYRTSGGANGGSSGRTGPNTGRTPSGQQRTGANGGNARPNSNVPNGGNSRNAGGGRGGSGGPNPGNVGPNQRNTGRNGGNRRGLRQRLADRLQDRRNRRQQQTNSGPSGAQGKGTNAPAGAAGANGGPGNTPANPNGVVRPGAAGSGNAPAGTTGGKAGKTGTSANGGKGKRAKRAAKHVLRKSKAAIKNKRDKKNQPTAVKPVVGNVVNKPKTSQTAGGNRPASTGGISMPTAAYVQGSAEMLGAATVYSPEGMMQVGNDLAQLPVALRNVAEAMRIMTERSHAEDPIDPAIIDVMGEVFQMLQSAAQHAEEVGPLFRNKHNVDIHRLENPRTNEHRWDVASNR